MANSIMYFGVSSAGVSVPFRVVDNGDGTYALATTTTNGAGVVCYLGIGADGKSLPLKAVANGDGTYSLLVA